MSTLAGELVTITSAPSSTMHSIAAALVVPPPALIAMKRAFQPAPATPVALSVTAAHTPTTCVPCSPLTASPSPVQGVAT